MKQFDFDNCKHCPQRIAWLKENHNKKMSEEEFVDAWQGFRGFSKANHKGRVNTPCKARKRYHRLKEKFGFFV